MGHNAIQQERGGGGGGEGADGWSAVGEDNNDRGKMEHYTLLVSIMVGTVVMVYCAHL